MILSTNTADQYNMGMSRDTFFLMLLYLCGRSYTQEKAPLYMYATTDDLEQAFGISSGKFSPAGGLGPGPARH